MEHRGVTGNVLLSGLLIAAVTWLCLEWPVLYAYLMSEDQGVEYATFVAAALAAVLVVVAMVRERRLRRPGYVLLALTAFALGMEEISWGQRILGIRTPAFFAERNDQREITLHNLFESGQHYRELAIATVVLVVALWLLAWRIPAVARFCERFGVPQAGPHLWPFFALVAYSQEWRVWWRPLVDAHELTELLAAVALAVLALDIVRRSRDPIRLAGAGPIGALLVLIAGLSVPFVLLFPDRAILPVEISRFATLEYPRLRLYRQALEIFEHLRRHPELATPEVPLRHGLLLRQVGDSAGARQILEEVLAGRRLTPTDGNQAPAAPLDVAEALFALGRAEEAGGWIEQARVIARRDLEQATDGDARASAQGWLGVAALMEGDSATAHAAFAAAREAGSTEQARRRLDERIVVYTRRRAALVSEPRVWQ